MRIGTGFDVHRFKEGGPIYLGGVEIPFEKSLVGHSDADVGGQWKSKEALHFRDY